MALQEDIIRALFGGIGGPTGMSLYNQEQPRDMLTGQPYMQNPSLGVPSMTKGQVSPLAMARQQTMVQPQAVNNQPQFNTRAQMDSYTGPNYAGMNRNPDEGIQDYVARLLKAPTGAGELSQGFMDAWEATNKTYAKNNEEPAAAKVTGGGSTSPTFNDNPWGAKWSDTPPPRPQVPVAPVEDNPRVSLARINEVPSSPPNQNASVLRDRDREQLALVKAFFPNGGTRNPLSNEGMIPSGQNRQIPDMSFENFLITLQDRFNRGM